MVTPNFRVHYHEDLRALAIRVSNLAENVLPELSRILGNRPDTPIHIVLSDDMDSPQGFAEVLPENVVTLFPAVPAPTSELGDFDDFMRLLLIHEMTHIVHLDTIGGIPAAFNQLFGKQWSPNLIQPRWVVEGIAVNLESHFTSAGRIRSNQVDMIMRAQIISNVFPPIDELSNINRRFLFGNFPWIFGGRLIDFIGRTYGEDAIAQISHEYGERPLPYAINLVTEHATQRSMVDIYGEWEAWERRHAEGLLARIRAEGVVEGERIPREAAVVRNLEMSPTGELAFVEEPRDGDTELVVLAPDLKTERVRLRTSSGLCSFTPDGRRLVATIADSYQHAYFFDDLEIIDVATGRRRRRTSGARISDPDLSPDGRTIAAVQQRSGRTWIVTLPLESGEPKVMYQPEEGDQVAEPRWAPDGASLVWSMLDPSGARNLVRYRPASGRLERLTEGMAHDVDPLWSPDGRAIYFASDRGGVFNAYRVDLESHALVKVTNVETGVFDLAISPDGRDLYFALFNAFGYDLHRLSTEQRGMAPDPELVRPVATASAAVAVFPIERYSPWETLIPKTWLPNTGTDGVGNTIGVSILQADALRQHAYTFDLHYGIESRRLGYYASYYNAMLVTPISLSSSLVATTRPGSFAPATPDQDRLQSIWRCSLGFSVPLGAWDTGHALSFNYSIELRRGLTLFSDDPFQTAPPLDPNLTLSAISVGWSFSNARGFAESISAAAGHSLSVNVRFNDPVLGSDLRIIEIVGRWSGFLTLPWLEHHVLALRVAVGGSAGDSRGRSVFVLGGLPVRNILSDAIDGIGVGSEVIRGYEPSVLRGNAFYLGTLEYRLPLWVIAWGVKTIPLFLDRLTAAAFVDAGATPNGRLRVQDTKAGVGGELRLDLDVGYVEGFTLRFGYGRGLMEGGIDNWYLVLGGVY